MTSYVIGQIIRFGGNLVLTRLLFPEYFGVVGLGMVVIVGIAMFSDLGLMQCVINSRNGDKEKFLNTAWTIQIFRGIVLALILALITYGLYLYQLDADNNKNNVYNDPLLIDVLSVFIILPILNGFLSTKVYLANRKLQLNNIVIMELVGQLVAFISTITIAYFTRSIWALVFGAVLSDTAKIILSHLLFDGPKNKLEWNKEYALEIIRYGKWILFSSVTGFLLSQGDRLILGGFISADLLGIYTIAFFLANSGYQVLLKVSSSVFFPALSEIERTKNSLLSNYFYKIRLRLDFIVFSIFGFLAISGDVWVKLLYDERYFDAGWMLKILSFTIISIIPVLVDQLFLAIGKPRYMTIASFIQVLTLYLMIPVGYHFWGLLGAIVSISTAFVPRYIYCLYMLIKLNIINLKFEIFTFFYTLFGLCIGIITKHFIYKYII